MRIFFFDDSGQKKGHDIDRYLCVAGFSIEAPDLPLLTHYQQEMWLLHEDLGKPGDELKFSHVGKGRDTEKKPNPLVRVGMTDFSERRHFVMQALSKLVQIESLEVIGAVVDKKKSFGPPPMHHALTVLFERAELSLQDKNTHGLMFCDDENKNEVPLRALLDAGSTNYVKFQNIKETIAFVPSVSSPGVQFADLVAGSIFRAANTGDTGYMEKLMPHVRTDSWGRWRGHGIKMYPTAPFPVEIKKPGA
ncbi:MAG: hypothetical protein RIS66_254 [Actinomycetota bacterium]|jgi:hypothetical protein